jgi:hypothetical protein
MIQAVDEKIPDKGAGYMIRLVAVALAAKWLVDTGKKDEGNRYYIRVRKKRFDTLRQMLEALVEQKKQ